VTFVLCFCACLLAALAYLAYRARLQALKIQRLARERLRLETDLALQARELHESNRVLEEAMRKIDDLSAARRVEESAVAAAAAVAAAEMIELASPMATPFETAQSEAATPGSPSEVPIWSDIDSAAVARLINLRTPGDSGPADLYGRLVELFESGSARALVELRTALEHGRFQDAATVSRKFASSAANVGALTFAQSVRELERLCLAGDAGHALGLYRRLRAAHPPLMVILQGKRRNAGASGTKSAEKVGYPSTPA
jgi:HPt (histidine-containing phosphotransfer) domain-containing protein